MQSDAVKIFLESVNEMLPGKAVRRSIKDACLKESIILTGIGKASWKMASAASQELNGQIRCGAIVTKYGHSEGPIPQIEIFEAGHPLPDSNTLKATERILDITKTAEKGEIILLLVSGGGSSLFEKPAKGLSISRLSDITNRLMLGGADINELNSVRKHLSSVKGGRFAVGCLPAKIFQIVLSDVIDDRLDIIASGPAVPDRSTSEDALSVMRKYGIPLCNDVISLLKSETPKEVNNVSTLIAGNVKGLCLAAKMAAEKKGYISHIVSDRIRGEARAAGEATAARALHEIEGMKNEMKKICMIWGGETTVNVKGSGKGGRSQELALAAAGKIAGISGTVVLSAGSDGSDGPTDAAGGIVDGFTWGKIRSAGRDPMEMLENNDSYSALEMAGALLKTGPTGTNVNDIVICLAESHRP